MTREKDVQRGTLTGKKMPNRYEDGIEEASKPIADRKACFYTRSGEMKAPRRHHLRPEQHQVLLDRMTTSGHFVSPFTKYGAYDGVVEALVRLGENEAHLFGDVVEEVEKYLSEDESKDKGNRTAWEKFRDRRARSMRAGKDHIGRIMQNITVLQRIGGVDPYALKLSQLGACIDVLKDERGAPLIKLRTGIPEGDHVVPMNETKKRQCSRPSGVNFLVSRRFFPDAKSVTSKEGDSSVSDEGKVPVKGDSG